MSLQDEQTRYPTWTKCQHAGASLMLTKGRGHLPERGPDGMHYLAGGTSAKEGLCIQDA